ncbi:MAG: hypothetical protein L6V91_10275 [Bacilli bacterium]|nr:MAG: hypothetical protein L6V91_10275 [Bacilli bacterium]
MKKIRRRNTYHFLKTPKELEKNPIKKSYLINLISQKDQTLASYVSANPHLLETTTKTITKIQNNWLKIY